MTQAKITVAETRIQKNHETAKTEDQKITAPE